MQQPPTLEEFYRSAGVQQVPAFAPFIRLSKAPFQSQRRALTLALAHDRWGIYDETGGGKTVPAQAAALYYIGFGNRALVLTLPILLQQFQEDLCNDFIGSDRYVRTHILQEAPDGRRKLFAQWEADNSWPELLIMTYEMFATATDWVESIGPDGQPLRKPGKSLPSKVGPMLPSPGAVIKERSTPVWEVLQKANYNVVITDETQKIRGTDGLMFKRVEAYVGRPEEGKTAFFPLTGTPMYTSPLDAYALIRLTSPDLYESWYHFERKHAKFQKIRLKNPIKGKNGREIRTIRKLVGYQRLEELNRNLYRRASRTMKADIPELTGLRSPIIRPVPVELHPKHLELYRRLAEERFLELGDGEIITALQEQELRQKVLQIVTCPELFCAPGEAPPNHMVSACLELMKEVIDDRKVIIFANFRKTVESLKGEFDEFCPAVIYGGMTPAARQTERDRFLRDDQCRALLANMEAAGAGLNLQHVSHTIIVVEPTSVPGRFKQAMDRIVRFGQEYQSMVYILKALSTVAPEAIKEMLRRDTDIAEVNRDRKSLRHFYQIAA